MSLGLSPPKRNSLRGPTCISFFSALKCSRKWLIAIHVIRTQANTHTHTLAQMCFHRGKVPHFPIFSYLFPVRGKLVPLHLWKLTCCAGVWNFPISCIREICAYGFLCWKQIIVRKVISILLMDPWQTP